MLLILILYILGSFPFLLFSIQCLDTAKKTLQHESRSAQAVDINRVILRVVYPTPASNTTLAVIQNIIVQFNCQYNSSSTATLPRN